MAASAGPTPKEAPPEDSPLQAEADDLTRMAGIGPTYAMRLRDGGITTFAQLAELEVGKDCRRSRLVDGARGKRAAARARGGAGSYTIVAASMPGSVCE